ncbi:MAG: divergent polysaccharide deacetylase family protein [Wenzhouxiangella sp.]|nr:divergent polysaccharide deacetylase family protein [Wenzhouxiangella sp.]MCH8476989.1 divergent polysaccharide deacetylase family protein [Wenzhouxiangella sp.]TVR95697.1 MAG: divergent polysaccharide deacetylase family protein [Wenzhouxiangellaceae bacterium]
MFYWRGVLVFFLVLLAVTAAAEPARIAVVIDDLGFRAHQDRAILDLDARIAVAIIPDAPGAMRLSRQAGEQGRDVLIHLPLAGLYHDNCEPALSCPGLDWSVEQMSEHLAGALERVPNAIGLNNHQGSRFTRDRHAVGNLIYSLKRLGDYRGQELFVLDSRTAPDTVLEETALQAGLAATRRHVFLDHLATPEDIERAWRDLIRLARRNGSAIAIGHPRPETIRFLRAALAELDEEAGLELVPISSLTRRRNLLSGLDEVPYPASR